MPAAVSVAWVTAWPTVGLAGVTVVAAVSPVSRTVWATGSLAGDADGLAAGLGEIAAGGGPAGGEAEGGVVTCAGVPSVPRAPPPRDAGSVPASTRRTG